MRTRWAILVPVILIATLGVAEAHQRHGAVTVDQLVRSALTIVEGEVDAVSSQWNAAHTQIHTTVRVFVTDYHKGGDGREIVEFRFLGGTVFDETLAIVGQPGFEVGEDVLLFLTPQWESADAPVVEMEHGKLTLREVAPGRQALVSGAGEEYDREAVIQRIREINAGREVKR